MTRKRRCRAINPDQLLIKQGDVSWLELCLAKTGGKYGLTKEELLSQLEKENQ
jgi:hypothetical protein